ncbi:hypothetical protein DFH08DRAFT_857940 [Mycena albidolilacea]|uniref:Arrestin-like N-terminal domain-containing protein n=1 Tax=Mycena albidolilacea TaxID=1033008 RepID=A0AAD7A8H4_9AGAR|nr:hypothetical protein DFH08DRAFT_857940 [Mycena albidolilacea]
MSTPHLPSYAESPESFGRTPSYSAEPGLYEQRLALNARSLPRPTGNFVKRSKHEDVKLRLAAQDDKLELPVYNNGASVEGAVELTKADSISSVEVKVEGNLELKENGEGGHKHYTLCLDTVVLWTKDADGTACPSALPFSLALPTEFEHEGRSYPLPPSHSIKLEGLPGFSATIDYSVSAIINKPHSINSKKLGIHIRSTIVSTPFIYCPRTRPPHPIPPPLQSSETGIFDERPEWKTYQSIAKVNATNGMQDIGVKFYLPASRIFCASQGIPFHITLTADAHSLAAFLPYGPVAGTSTTSRTPATRIQLMRQSAVDVKHTATRGEHVNTAIWRVDYLGEAAFRHAHDGPTCVSFSGEIKIDTKVMGFAVPGLMVQDCILLTVTPPEGTHAPFVGIREVIPVRLATDVWTDGRTTAAESHSSKEDMME